MFELSDQVFARVQPLLPANSRRGKPWRDHRQVLGGILTLLYRSSGGGQVLPLELAEHCEDLAGDVALQSSESSDQAARRCSARCLAGS
jgi:hypothetical protein